MYKYYNARGVKNQKAEPEITLQTRLMHLTL